MCGCAYLNGWGAILAVQLLVMIGMFFSVAALGDCSFVELDERLFFPADMDDNLPIKVTQTQFVGFLTWKKLDGSCYWYNFGSNPDEQLLTFSDILGRDWEMARLVAIASSSLSFLFFCYLISFTCSSQVRGVRYFNTVFLSVVLTTLHGVTFLALDSSFCEEYGCTFSRSAGFSVASMGCFFLSGICFCCTTDYPGPRWNKKTRTLMATTTQIAPEQQKRDSALDSVEMRGSMLASEEMRGSILQNEEMRGSMLQNEEYNDGERYVLPLDDDEEDLEIEEVMPDYDIEEVLEEDMIEEEVIEDDEEGTSFNTGSTSVVDNKNQDQTFVEEASSENNTYDNGELNTMVELSAGDSCEVTTEVTEDEIRVVEAITHADGTQTLTKTVEQIANDDGNANEGQEDDFVAHPDLEAGDDCEVITEVTEDEVRTVETITHADGSQTVTETFEEIADEKKIT